jgi:hypothetical protein
MNRHARFGVMIATSTIVMFGLMYLNTYQLDHVFFSETRAYADDVLQPARERSHFRRQHSAVRAGALARAQPGDR